jgi:hypothetical protein
VTATVAEMACDTADGTDAVKAARPRRVKFWYWLAVLIVAL